VRASDYARAHVGVLLACLALVIAWGAGARSGGSHRRIHASETTTVHDRYPARRPLQGRGRSAASIDASRGIRPEAMTSAGSSTAPQADDKGQTGEQDTHVRTRVIAGAHSAAPNSHVRLTA